MLRHYAVLRILLALFFLYFAWPIIPQAASQLEQLFWASWVGFFLLVFGANLATLLQITKPPIMEQKKLQRSRTYNR